MSASNVVVAIPGEAVARRVRQLREGRQFERNAIRERRVAHHARAAGERRIGALASRPAATVVKFTELRARRDLLQAETSRFALNRVDRELEAVLEAGSGVENVETLISSLEAEAEIAWERQARQEAAIEAIASPEWCQVEEGSLTREGEQTRARLQFTDGRTMAIRNVTPLNQANGDEYLAIEVAGAAIHEVQSETGVVRGCEAETAYISKLAADSGSGATIVPEPSPGWGVAVNLNSRSVGS